MPSLQDAVLIVEDMPNHSLRTSRGILRRFCNSPMRPPYGSCNRPLSRSQRHDTRALDARSSLRNRSSPGCQFWLTLTRSYESDGDLPGGRRRQNIECAQ